MKEKSYAIRFFIIICTFFLFSDAVLAQQSSVNDVQASRVERPEQLELYTNGSEVYSFGIGTENDLLLEAFQVDNTTNFGIDKIADRIILRRNGTMGQGSNGEERHILFFEKDATFSGNTKNFRGGFFPTMETALVCTCINRGADNVFANAGGTNINNIQRLDFIFEDGIVVPDNPEEGGFPIFERGANDRFKFALITSLNSNADPSSYGDVISYAATDWETTGFTNNSAVLSGFPNDGGNLIQSANLSNQNIGVIFISFDDLGLSAGDVIYGYSLAGDDATSNSTNFLDFTNSTYFPLNTNETNGGLDLLSGGSFSRKAFIHTKDGWYQDEDPNDDTPNCDALLTISGGEANLNSSMVFKEISAVNGSLNLNGNTVDVCENFNSRFPFEVINGTVNFNGTLGQQKITGANNFVSFESLNLDNSDGLFVDSPVELFESLTIDDGDLEVNREFIFRCDFSGSNPKTAMIGDLTNGNIIGDITTEQCFPARRAFRFVSPSLTTTTSIRANWQEDAASWDDNPNPGYGTHITGLGVQNATPTNDGQNGFDWQPSGNPSLFVYDNENEEYSPITGTLGSLQAGSFYRLMIRGSRATDIQFNDSAPTNTILRETGSVLKGPFSSSSVPTSPSSDQTFMQGNPFQSIVDLEQVYNASSNIKLWVAVWDPTLGGSPVVGQPGGRGAFVLINMTTGSSSNSSSEMNQFQQAKQAMFFYADGNGTPEVVFNETAKDISEDQTQVFSNPSSHLQISLYDQTSYNNNATSDDGVRIDFQSGGNNMLDNQDAKKISNQDENLARMFGNQLIAYETRDYPEHNETLPLFINQYRDTDYVFEVNNYDLPQGTTAYLKDNYLNTQTELPAGVSTINFGIDATIQASIAPNRFSIVFEIENFSIDHFEKANIALYPNPALGNEFWINANSLSGEEVNVVVYDMLGKKVASHQQEVGQNGTVHLTGLRLKPGMYLVQLNTKSTSFQTKLIKK